MSDLVEFLAAEAERQRPAGAPPFDRLIARRRRRDRLHRGSAAAGAALAVLAVVGGASLVTRGMEGTGEVARPDERRSIVTGLTPSTGQVCDERGCVALSEQSAQVVARAVNASVPGDEATAACVRAEPAVAERLELGYATSPTRTFPVVLDCQAVIGSSGEPRHVSRRLVEDVRQLLSRTPPPGRRPLAPELAFFAFPAGGGEGTRLEGDDVQVREPLPVTDFLVSGTFIGDGSDRRVCGVTYEVRSSGSVEDLVRVLERDADAGLSDGPTVLDWDGTDAAGEPVPAGSYPLVAVAEVVDGECDRDQRWQETYALNIVFVVG